MTDRRAPDGGTLIPNITVANGRGMYFSFGDGSLLHIIGGGQNVHTHIPFTTPTYIEKNGSYFSPKYYGLASEQEALRAWNALEQLKDSRNLFTQFLGYQYLKKVPDGQGHLVNRIKTETVEPESQNLDNLVDRDGSLFVPVLIFNRVLYPQRLVQLPSIVISDPGLERLRRKISKTMANLGLLPSGEVLSASDLMTRGLEKKGEAEAVKQNKRLFKITIHNQDYVFPTFEEADNAEFVGLEEYIRLVKAGKAMKEMDLELLKTHGLSTAGVDMMIDSLKVIFSDSSPVPRSQVSILFPSPHESLLRFFMAYFSKLDKKYLQLWATEVIVHGRPRPLPFRNAEFYLDQFHPFYKEQERDTHLSDKVYKMIQLWAEIALMEYDKRGQGQTAGGEVNAVSSSADGNIQTSKNLGGIDMNQKNLDLQTSGEGTRFDKSFDPGQIPNIKFDGFSPVILRIVPTNLPVLLGQTQHEVEMKVSKS